jgi:undecaprenyl-diphosphatase
VDLLTRLVANFALYAVGLAAVGAWLRTPRPQKPAFAVAGVVAAALVAVGVKVAGAIWTDPRPFVVDHTVPLIKHSVDNGFPSDHTALAAAVAAVVLLWHRRTGAALLVVAALLGASRVAAHVHHWPDVFTGFAIGLVCAALGALVARALAPRFSRALERREGTV